MMMVMLDRGDYWQCAYVIPKGGIEQVKAKGLDAFRDDVVWMSPFLADRVGELKSWDDIKLLSVTVDRLQKWWRPGLICIGDAAHAMSPIGGVGINLAVQDAVAAANRLRRRLKAGTVERRRPARHPAAAHVAGALHAMAAAHHPEADHQPRAGKPAAAEAAAIFKLFGIFPALRRIPARLLGVGIRPEHVTRRIFGAAVVTGSARSSRFATCAAAIPCTVRCGEDFDQPRFGLGIVSSRLPTVSRK